MPALSKPTLAGFDYPTRIGALFDAFNNGNYNFPAVQVPSADPNVFDDYEEGNWTPTDASGAGLVLTINSAKYTKKGREFTIEYGITFPATANGANANTGGMPFSEAAIAVGPVRATAGSPTSAEISSGTSINYLVAGGGIVTNAVLSGASVRSTIVCTN